MPDDRTKRCAYCGGTLFQDGGVVKCLMCSRLVEGQEPAPWVPTRFSNPKLPGTSASSAHRRGK